MTQIFYFLQDITASMDGKLFVEENKCWMEKEMQKNEIFHHIEKHNVAQIVSM